MTAQTVYIDGDILPYKVGFATQTSLWLLDKVGEHTCSPAFIFRGKTGVNRVLKQDPDFDITERFFVEEPIQAIETLKLAIQNIVRASQCDLFKVVVSGPDNFRDKIATIQPYKGNRTDFVKPVHWQLLRDWLEEKPYTIVSEGEEADDVLSRAMLAGHVGATIDKDLDNTPGTHYNFNKGIRYEITQAEADRNFYRQCLTGDTADHIPGIRGIGPKTADKLLPVGGTPEDMERTVYEQYQKQYGDEAFAALTEVGRLLWMRREEGELWEPIAVRE